MWEMLYLGTGIVMCQRITTDTITPMSDSSSVHDSMQHHVCVDCAEHCSDDMSEHPLGACWLDQRERPQYRSALCPNRIRVMLEDGLKHTFHGRRHLHLFTAAQLWFSLSFAHRSRAKRPEGSHSAKSACGATSRNERRPSRAIAAKRGGKCGVAKLESSARATLEAQSTVPRQIMGAWGGPLKIR